MRIAALHYLAVLPSTARYDILHPYRSLVIRELSKALDDPKRSVRGEAVRARYFRFCLLAFLFTPDVLPELLGAYLIVKLEMHLFAIYC